ncbi:DNA-binding protein [Streptomyces sp. NPDC001480]|uniref:nSTAND1 domain-containing NTPase n=1 Tax=Streptomyces sp. NPDC001480 TaxID=3364577 RepID=UPI00368A36BD
MSVAGRPESPLDPNAGPVQRLAAELRKLRAEAGSPTYRVMAQRAGQGASTLSQAAAGERLPTLPVVLAYVQACGGDPEDWEARWRQAAAEAAAEARTEDQHAEPPYRGLARFEPGDADLFFGRDRLTDRLFELTRIRRFTAVFGPSGSGKSSLLRAGLIPRLRAPDQATPQPAALRVLTPGEHPLRTHEQRLTPKDGDGDTWLIVDQFEELYTLCHDPDERDQFIDRLLTAIDPGSRLRVVIAVRADFLGRCAEHPALTAALQDGTVLAGPMSRDELREAIVKPAQRAGMIVERALSARLLDEVEGEPGALPLMSHALLETWYHRKGRALTLEAYESLGGLHGAITRTAEDIHGRFTPAQADLACRILLRLVTPGDGAPDTRRPARREEFDFGEPADTATVIEQLVRARLLTLDDDQVDLAHEALISAWPRLRSWIDTDRERLRVHRRLTEAATAWDALDRDPGALYRGIRLAAAEDAFAGDRTAELTRLEQAFLRTSRARRSGERRRLRTFSASMSILLVLALVAGAIAWQQNRANDRRHVEAEARRVAAVAGSMRFSDPVTAMRLSVAAWKLAHTTETRAALVGAMTQREQDVFTVPDPDSPTAVRHLTADGRTLVSVSSDHVQTWDLRTHRQTHEYRGPGRLASEADDVVLSPDGNMLALVMQGGVRLWDVRAGRTAAQLGHGAPLFAHFSASGHTLLVLDEATDPSSIQVWDVRKHRLLTQVRPRFTSGSAVSPDDRWLLMCEDDRPLQVWDIAKGQRATPLWARKLGRGSCHDGWHAFSPDNRQLMFVTDTAIRRWDLHTGRELPQLAQEGYSTEESQFSVEGDFLATTTASGIVLWRFSSPDTPVFRHALTSEAPSELRLDLAAGVVRYLNKSGTAVRSLNLGRATTAQWHSPPYDGAQLSDDGRHLAVLRWAGDKAFSLRDTRNGRVVSTPPGNPCLLERPGADRSKGKREGTVVADCNAPMALSSDGRIFAYLEAGASTDVRFPRRQRITVWDVTAQQRVASIDIRSSLSGLEDVKGLALDARGRTLFVSRDTTQSTRIELWDVHRQKRIKTLVGILADDHSLGEIISMGGITAVRPDTHKLVSGQGAVIDMPSGRVIHRVLSDDDAETLAFSPDGEHLAVGDISGRVTLWDGDVRRRVGVLPGTYTGSPSDSPDPIDALAFSPDGRTLAVAAGSGTVQLWDVPSNQPLGSPLPTAGDGIFSLAFGADGDTLYAAGTNVFLQRYDLTPAHLVRQACARAHSGLSRSAWKTYLPSLTYRRTC